MPKTKSSPTLDDVATAAGVSTATVSRCLNTPERVVKATRERVMFAVEKLGYTPNFGARVMAARRTLTIGAIIPTMENAIFARGLQAFQEGLHARGYTLLVASSGYSPELEKQQIRALVARGADGLLLIGYDRDPAIYAYLERQNVPVLVAWAFDGAQNQPSIGFDNSASMEALAREVLARGHTRIGVISGVTLGNDRAAERLAGIRAALKTAGCDPGGLNVIETPYDIDNGAKAFETLMRRALRPTAIMCGNDVLAAGAMRRAREMGMNIPGDVSVTGFDDIELARIVTPSLTTVRVPHREMGFKAATALVDLVEQTGTSGSVQLQCAVCIRDSLGPVRVN